MNIKKHPTSLEAYKKMLQADVDLIIKELGNSLAKRLDEQVLANIQNDKNNISHSYGKEKYGTKVR